MEKVFVIIVTYNATKWVQQCFSSLQNSSIKLQTIVVDNNSSDRTVQLIKNDFPEVTLIESKDNLGFGKANNLAIKKALDAGADSFFLLNQDAWVEEDTIEKLQIALRENPDYGILSPLHFNGEGNLLDYKFYKYITQEGGREMYSSIITKTRPFVHEVSFVNAAAWLVSKSCLEKVGAFDPLFSHYGEDVNFIYRLHFHQLKVGVLSDTKAFHDREDRVFETKRKSVERAVIDCLSTCSDLSKELDSQVAKQKKILISKRIKSLIKGDFNNYQYYGKVLSLFLKKLAQLKLSREVNQEVGLKYLN